MSPTERFDSLAALRSAHAALLRVTDDEPTPGDLDRVAEFLRKAAATGAILDTPDDRKQAQGLITTGPRPCSPSTGRLQETRRTPSRSRRGTWS